MAKDNKYTLYERSVQSPEYHIDWLAKVFRDIRGHHASRLREDFCGTFRIACEWVKRNRRNTALAIDLDPEPLAYGKRMHRSRLSAGQRDRLTVLNGDVLSVTDPGADLIVACNFSFFIFKTRKQLVEYFRFCRRSLGSEGVLILEMAGGPGMIEPVLERKSVSKNGKPWFTYVWDQKSFDPVQRNGHYAIHFRFPGKGRSLRNAFTYDWRLWTIPEVREALQEAGFKSSVVYWETEHEGAGTGEFVRTEVGDNAYAWISYVVGVR